MLVAALFVRFVDPARAPDRRRSPSPAELRPEHLRLVRLHHRIFYLLLAAGPLEWWLRGRPAGGLQLLGGLVFALGLYGYRSAGRELGEHLSPLVAPREPAALVEGGPYRSVRHPMYRAEILMAFGVPILLAAPLATLLAAWFALTVLRRIAVEETVLAERLPAYRSYAGRTARLVRRIY